LHVLQSSTPHDDYGNAARAIGSVSAIVREFDAIAYLDADNWFDDDHLERLLRSHRQSNAAICTTGRKLYDFADGFMGICPEVDGTTFVDMNCYFLTRQAFGLITYLYMTPLSHCQLVDRILWNEIVRSGIARHHDVTPSVNYRTLYAFHYRYFGMTPPPNAKVATLRESGSAIDRK
jgi:hypothetical protein